MKRSLNTLFAVIFLSTLAASCNSGNNPTTPAAVTDSSGKKWWKEAVVYQVYPRSFKDSDGDGIGDLKGIISKLDYIKSLGVNAVWLNPIYSSPNDDNGYDVSNYQDIMKDFGTMDDFNNLLKGMHERGIRLVMDIVVNHSSDEHDWFKQSRSSRTSPYRNYYHWWNAERGTPPHRYSLFDVNHDAWKYDSLTNAYYLHYFSAKQPDLNWENPALRQEIYKMMRFWADKGVDGFRLDAFQFAAKDTSWPVFPKELDKNFIQYYAMVDGIHNYLGEMNKEVFSKYDVMSVAEGAGRNFTDAHQLVDADRHELNLAYAFDAVDLAKMPDSPGGSAFNILKLKEVFTRWDSAFADNGWLSIFLANHDQARLVTRFGNDAPQFREVSAKMLNTFLLTMRGTPFCYAGDELGMKNIRFDKIEDYRDVATLNEYQYQKKHGGNLQAFLKQKAFESRDNGRTPFQWDSSVNAGFTTGKPWIPLNPDYTTVNVAAEDKDQGSVLNFFRKLVALRKANSDVLVYGKYSLIDKNNPAVYAYTREADERKFLVLLNFTAKEAPVVTGTDVRNKKILINNYEGAVTETLKPYQAVILEL